MKNIIKAIMRKTAKINKNVAQVREEATEANQTSKLLLKEKMMKVNFSKGSPVVENLMKVDFPEFQSSIDSLRISCDYRGKHYVIQLWRADGVSKDRVNINCKRAVDNKLFVDPVMLINVEDSIRKAVVTGRAEERAASVDKMAA